MKLDRLVLVLGSVALGACASTPVPRAETTITSAATSADASAAVTGPAVRSSKVQRAESEELAPKDADEDVRREPSRRGGFGAWKK